MNLIRKGKFITFEGIDGAGKSTHIQFVSRMLKQVGIDHIITREPGGTPLGERLRDILLHQEMHVATEALLMFAARQEHLEQKILPTLRQGIWVISDRFSDASFAYQGTGKQFSWTKLEQLESWVLGDMQPDLTLLFNLPVEVAEKRRSGTHNSDKFEQEKNDFFQRVRAGYLRRAEADPNRFRIIDSLQTITKIQNQITNIIQSMIDVSH